MFYAGLFGYHYESEKFESRRGGFIYFVEATDPEAAVEAFKSGIKKTAGKRQINLHGEIIFKSFVEIKKLPPDGAMAFLEEGQDDEHPRITLNCDLPGTPDGLKAYEWFEDGKEEPQLDDMYELDTFMIIPKRKTKTKNANI